MEITKSFTPSNLADWRDWLAWKAFQEIAPSLQRNYILRLSDAKKPETFERRLQILVDEVTTGKPTSMH